MPYEPPTLPANLPTEIINTLNESSLELLRDVATYAEAFAEEKEREVRLEESADQEEIKGRPDDFPDDIPVKVTIKQISDNRYDYWQWREGDKIKSEYKCPVDPDE
ncbi:hypothetical protein [Halosegnis longus]|uniref:Uncharacterized protein n=1 Tax=Halosegnis longus TaxID=2216012 RepID=A0AAJ4R6J2_9EURY|nr:hypothetical protein Nmn1133_13875 [Salella cibi]